MKRSCIRLIFVFTWLLLCFAFCRNATRDDSMQPYDGYPVLSNADSMRELLASRSIDSIKLSIGDTIADIGAGNGYLEGILAYFHDSLTFYIQDIDTSICNDSSVSKVVDFYKKLKQKHFTSKFIAVNGTDSTTNLPDKTFDKIFMLFTYQYLKTPKAFILDVRKKLKDDGLFYVVNPQYRSYSNLEFQRREYGWNASPLEKEISDIIDSGFELINISRRAGETDDPYLMVFKLRN